MRRIATASALLLAATAAQAAQPVQKWEYATLLVTDTLGCSWRSATEYQRADEPERKASTYSIYKALGGKRAAGDISITDVLNLIGDKGFDLVSVQKTNAVDVYIFKRPKA